MANTIDAYLNNPIVVVLIIIGIIILFVFGLKRKQKDSFVEFKPRKSKDTIYDELKKKVRLQGLRINKGKIIIGVNKVADIEKWMRIKGKFTPYMYDENNKEYVIDDSAEETPYDLLVFLAKNKNWLLRVLGLKKFYFLLNYNSFLRFDDLSNSFILEDGTDLILYNDVFCNSSHAMEYLHDISIKRMNIEVMTAIENYPAKVVHLEMQQAKKERLNREIMETERAKYDSIKKAEDTAVS